LPQSPAFLPAASTRVEIRGGRQKQDGGLAITDGRANDLN